MPNGFHPPPISRQVLLIFFIPKSSRRSHLWGCRRRTFTVFADVRTLKDRPRNVRRVRRQRRGHATIRAPTALKLPIVNVVIRPAVSHHSTYSNRAAISGRVYDVVRR